MSSGTLVKLFMFCFRRPLAAAPLRGSGSESRPDPSPAERSDSENTRRHTNTTNTHFSERTTAASLTPRNTLIYQHN